MRGIKSLAEWCAENGEFGEQLLSEFTGIARDGTVLTPDDITFGKETELKWKCKKGHTWFASVNRRTSHRSKCPCCSGKQVHAGNSLLNWCQKNEQDGKRILKEFTGETVSGEHLLIDQVSYGSSKKMIWKCASGHEWITTPFEITIKHKTCPHCGTLKQWFLTHGDRGKQLQTEFLGINDDGEKINPENITYGNKSCPLRWKCKKGHEWITPAAARTIRNNNCPYCSGHKVSELNSLKNWCDTHQDIGEQIRQEFTGKLADGTTISLDEISFGSCKKVVWKCQNGHIWQASVNNRTYHYNQCPFCPREKRSRKKKAN